MENLCCNICLSLTKKTINIYSTDLQYVYEKLANFELRDTECWVCYICRTRLRQCHQLQQLAVRTRGLIDDVFQNKIDFKFGTIRPLLELSISKTTIISSYKEQDLCDMELHKDNGGEEDKILDNTINHKVKEQTFIKSEDDESSQDLANEDKGHEIKLVDISQIVNVYVPQNTTNSDIEDLEYRTQSKYEQSLENLGIKQEIKEEIEDEGVNEQDSTNNKERDHKKEVLSVCHKKTLTCDICHKIFTYKSQLISHLRIHTDEKPFKCNKCSKEFSLKMNLKRHFIFNHTDVRYSCDICSNKFTDSYYLKKHKLKLHSDVKPFTCQTCSKSFSTQIQLTRHKLTHTREKLLSCDVCSKKFSHRSHLVGHKQIHDKPFTCDVCRQKFARNSALKRHMQSHAGEQPFSCDVCSKRFTCKSSLNHHTIIHTGDKKHICNICGRKFSLKRYLNSHLQTHTGIKKYSCDICYKEFTHKSSLQTHFKRVH